MHFVSRLFSLPLRTATNTKGLYTEDELYAVLALIYVTIYLNMDPVKTYPLQQAASTVSEQLSKLIETSVGGVTGWFGGGDKSDPLAAHGTDLIKTLSKSGLNSYAIAWEQVLPTIESMVPIQGTVVRILLPCLFWVRSTCGLLTLP